MECSRGSYLLSWERGSLWQIIMYVVSDWYRLLFISDLRQKKGTYSQSTGKRRSAMGDRSWMYGVIMTQNVWAVRHVLHCEGLWLTAKLKDQGWNYLPTNSIIVVQLNLITPAMCTGISHLAGLITAWIPSQFFFNWSSLLIQFA